MYCSQHYTKLYTKYATKYASSLYYFHIIVTSLSLGRLKQQELIIHWSDTVGPRDFISNVNIFSIVNKCSINFIFPSSYMNCYQIPRGLYGQETGHTRTGLYKKQERKIMVRFISFSFSLYNISHRNELYNTPVYVCVLNVKHVTLNFNIMS